MSSPQFTLAMRNLLRTSAPGRLEKSPSCGSFTTRASSSNSLSSLASNALSEHGPAHSSASPDLRQVAPGRPGRRALLLLALAALLLSWSFSRKRRRHFRATEFLVGAWAWLQFVRRSLSRNALSLAGVARAPVHVPPQRLGPASLPAPAKEQALAGSTAITVATEAWPVDFSHADVLPEGGYTVTRIAGAARHDAGLSIVFLHGAGHGDGPKGWVGLWSSLLLTLPPGTEVLIPSGPVTVLAGHEIQGPLPGWIKFSESDEGDQMAELTAEERQQRRVVFGGIDDVAAAMRDLLASEARRPGRRAVLGGFSQGGAVSMWTAMSAPMPQQPAAVFCLSGYLPQPHRLPADAVAPPTLLLHGDADDVVPPALSIESTMRLFLKKGWEHIEVRLFPGLKHKVKRQELDHLCGWLRQFAPEFPDARQGTGHLGQSRL